MKKTQLVTFACGAVLLSGLVGCGGEDGETGFEDEQIGEINSALTATGCASIKVSAEAHTGALIDKSSSHPEIWIQRIKFQLYNPSTTNCAAVSITNKVTNDTYGTVIKSGHIDTSLTAGHTRWIWQDINFDSRTYTPKQGYDEDVWMYRNGTLMKATYLPQYFTVTGQY